MNTKYWPYICLIIFTVTQFTSTSFARAFAEAYAEAHAEAEAYIEAEVRKNGYGAGKQEDYLVIFVSLDGFLTIGIPFDAENHRVLVKTDKQLENMGWEYFNPDGTQRYDLIDLFERSWDGRLDEEEEKYLIDLKAELGPVGYAQLMSASNSGLKSRKVIEARNIKSDIRNVKVEIAKIKLKNELESLRKSLSEITTSIKITGGTKFEIEIIKALLLLHDKAPEDLEIVLKYIKEVRIYHLTGVYIPAKEMLVDGRSAYYSTTWLASAFTHEAWHVKLYEDYLEKNPNNTVPKEVYMLQAAELECFYYQIETIKKIDPDNSYLIEYLESADGLHYTRMPRH